MAESSLIRERLFDNIQGFDEQTTTEETEPKPDATQKKPKKLRVEQGGKGRKKADSAKTQPKETQAQDAGETQAQTGANVESNATTQDEVSTESEDPKRKRVSYYIRPEIDEHVENAVARLVDYANKSHFIEDAAMILLQMAWDKNNDGKPFPPLPDHIKERFRKGGRPLGS